MDPVVTGILGNANPDRHSTDFIPINQIIWGQEEQRAVTDVFNRNWFGPGHYVHLFSEKLAETFNVRYVQPVNSGSSALLLAVEALLHLHIIRQGDYVLHPACTFPTSINPLLQAGLRPMLVDVERSTFNIDPTQARAAIDARNVKAALIPHLLGNVTDIDQVRGTVPLIEDSCDTIGTTYKGQMAGSLGLIGCLSFYGSHHISSGGVGGALLTNDKPAYEVVKSMTAWGRADFQAEPEVYERFKKRYQYNTLGYDFQMTEFQAAFGLAQMGKLADFNQMRRNRFRLHRTFFEENGGENFIHPTSAAGADPSWFAYPLVLSETAKFNRRTLVEYLVSKEVECRPLFVGNILKQPAYERPNVRRQIAVWSATPEADYLHEYGLFIPCWPMPSRVADRLYQTLYDFLRSSNDKRHRSGLWQCSPDRWAGPSGHGALPPSL